MKLVINTEKRECKKNGEREKEREIGKERETERERERLGRKQQL